MSSADPRISNFLMEAADLRERIAQLKMEIDFRKTLIEGYGNHVLKQDQRLAEARQLIEYFSSPPSESFEMTPYNQNMLASKKWLEENP